MAKRQVERKSTKAIDTQQFNGVDYYKWAGGTYYWRRGKSIHQAVWEFHNGSIPDGHEIHHKDEDPSNNHIDNLECLTDREHAARHPERGKSKEQLAHLESIREKAAAWHGSPEGIEWHRQHGERTMAARRVMRKYVCVVCSVEFQSDCIGTKAGTVRFCSPKCCNYWQHRHGKRKTVAKQCPYCRKDFVGEPRKKFCSKGCSTRSWQAARRAGVRPDGGG